MIFLNTKNIQIEKRTFKIVFSFKILMQLRNKILQRLVFNGIFAENAVKTNSNNNTLVSKYKYNKIQSILHKNRKLVDGEVHPVDMNGDVLG